MKYLEITTKRAYLKENYQKEVEEKFKNSLKDKPTDSEGRTADWYIDMGMEVPEELIPIDLDSSDLTYPLTEEYFNFKTKTAFIPYKSIEYMAGNDKNGVDIFLYSGARVEALENEDKLKELLKQNK